MPAVFNVMFIKIFCDHMQPVRNINTLRAHESALAAAIAQAGIHAGATQHEIIIFVAKRGHTEIPVRVENREIVLYRHAVWT